MTQEKDLGEKSSGGYIVELRVYMTQEGVERVPTRRQVALDLGSTKVSCLDHKWRSRLITLIIAATPTGIAMGYTDLIVMEFGVSQSIQGPGH